MSLYVYFGLLSTLSLLEKTVLHPQLLIKPNSKGIICFGCSILILYVGDNGQINNFRPWYIMGLNDGKDIGRLVGQNEKKINSFSNPNHYDYPLNYSFSSGSASTSSSSSSQSIYSSISSSLSSCVLAAVTV